MDGLFLVVFMISLVINIFVGISTLRQRRKVKHAAEERAKFEKNLNDEKRAHNNEVMQLKERMAKSQEELTAYQQKMLIMQAENQKNLNEQHEVLIKYTKLKLAALKVSEDADLNMKLEKENGHLRDEITRMKHTDELSKYLSNQLDFLTSDYNLLISKYDKLEYKLIDITNNKQKQKEKQRDRDIIQQARNSSQQNENQRVITRPHRLFY